MLRRVNSTRQSGETSVFLSWCQGFTDSKPGPRSHRQVVYSTSLLPTVADLNISVPHNLQQDEVLRRLQWFIANARTQYADRIQGFQEAWNGNTVVLRVAGMGQQVEGTITINPSDVTVQSRLPFMATMFRGRIENGIREQLGRLLA
jgi:Putative polyhydroxyalkanoic acid system protein (PHA_gran_rgn)